MTRGKGQNLFRKWRDHFDLTQDVLALRAGLPKSTISKLENGHIEYTQGHVEAIAEALGIEPADLIGRLPGAPNELTLLVNRVPPDRVEEVKAYLKMAIKAA